MHTALSTWAERIAAGARALTVKSSDGARPFVLPDTLPRRFGLITGRRSSPPFRAEGLPRSATPEPGIVSALGAHLDAVARAEASALRLGERLLPWGGTLPDAIEWFVVDGPLPRINDFGSAFSSAQWSVEAAVEEAGEPTAVATTAIELPSFARDCLIAHGNWQLAVEKALEVPPNHWPREAVKGQTFAALADPTSAALEVWATGFLLEANFDDADRTLRFYAPAPR